MLNQVVLIGRLNEDITGNRITISVPRRYENEFGEYENDIFRVILNDSIAKTTYEYCKKGDLLGIKGQLKNDFGNIVIIAEKITFLSRDRG